ncbi:flagellar hook-length control protein FliK [Helicobacter sp. 11S02629-2]|uniref:flagellar hook-length control protein FliK n=1 Tax=Helicobacter sp. 11S02629-2 TaxID=1476195 RepID=UPI000BA5C3D7|nr:flagellar hook-length control protein FliK [Helicobacter sp. 11S02629-2]PAF45767.1 hypothetical protein BKH40_02515 [Helicobacter sp. 11S02629-2]
MSPKLLRLYSAWLEDKQAKIDGDEGLKLPAMLLKELGINKSDDSFKTFLKTLSTSDLDKLTKMDDKKVAEKKDAMDTQGVTNTPRSEVEFKNAQAREMVKNFASQFREQVLNYKPPITKINLELNPASLGSVQMSISKKGKDLSVNITSSQSVMTMFMQNQQDLRANLMQIGFNNLDLNFSQHNQNSQNGQQNMQDSGTPIPPAPLEETKDASKLQEASLEIILPNYA